MKNPAMMLVWLTTIYVCAFGALTQTDMSIGTAFTLLLIGQALII